MIGLEPISNAPNSMAPMPADANPRTLREILNEAIAITDRDGVLSDDEMAAWTEVLTWFQMKVQGWGAQQPQAPGDPMAAQQGGPMSPQNPYERSTSEYGSHQGTPKPERRF